MERTTSDSKDISAARETVYQALTNPEALAVCLVPGEMTGKVRHFELKVGGGYEMSLYYPPNEKKFQGKTSAGEDRYTARFLEIIPSEKIVQAITFDSDDPAFSGEMIMEVTLKTIDTGTRVTFAFKDIPPGIRPEDNKAGTRSSLEKLARYVGG